jgi:hypothetical protein
MASWTSRSSAGKIRALPVLHFRADPHVPAFFGYPLPPPGRKRGGKRPALLAAVAGGRLVGHPLGADLHGSVYLQ